jgi:uncharacterized protein with HEPN domain
MLRDNASLLDIYKAGNKIISFAEGFTAQELAADEMRLSAILYEFIVIGEATKRLSPQFRDQHPELPWTEMAGLRNVLAHQYDKVDVQLLHRSIRVSLPEALEKIISLLPKLPYSLKALLRALKASADSYQIRLMLRTKPGITSLQSIDSGASSTTVSCPSR